MRTGSVLACRSSDTTQAPAVGELGGMATCTCCGYVLLRRSRFSLSFWTALTVTALIVFIVANHFPLARLTMLGKTIDATFIGALWLTWQQGHQVLSIMTGLAGFWFPLTQLCFLLWALRCIRRGRVPPDFKLARRI